MKLEALGQLIGPSFVLATMLIALLATAISPPLIKRRLRTALVLCLLYAAHAALSKIVPHAGVRQMVEAAAYLFASLAAARVFFVLLVDLAWERGGKRPINQLLRDVMQALVYALAALTALRAAGIEATSLLATGTVVTAVVGLALQDTLGNVAAGAAIQIDKPIALGDWVRLDKGDVIGRVVSTNWRSVTIQGDDRLYVVVPNNVFSRTPFTNFSRPGGSFRRNLYFTIPAEVPPNRVHESILEACADTETVLADPAPSVLTWQFTDSGIQYWLRLYIADFAARDRVQGELLTRIWFHLHRRKIPLAVPVMKNFVHEMDEEAVTAQSNEVLRDRRAAIEAVDFLGALPEEAKDDLARRGHRKLFAPRETILRSGDKGREFYIVRRGEVVVRVGEHEVARLGPGEFFGELALLTGKERHGTVVAIEETEVFEVDEKMFRDVLQSDPRIAEKISDIVGKRQAELQGQVSGQPASQTTSQSTSNEILSKIRSLFGLD